MINDLINLMTYKNIYLIANWGVIPFWLMLIIIPNSKFTNFFVQSIIAPLILGFAYCYIGYNIFLEGNIIFKFTAVTSLTIPSAAPLES